MPPVRTGHIAPPSGVVVQWDRPRRRGEHGRARHQLVGRHARKILWIRAPLRNRHVAGRFHECLELPVGNRRRCPSRTLRPSRDGPVAHPACRSLHIPSRTRHRNPDHPLGRRRPGRRTCVDRGRRRSGRTWDRGRRRHLVAGVRIRRRVPGAPDSAPHPSRAGRDSQGAQRGRERGRAAHRCGGSVEAGASQSDFSREPRSSYALRPAHGARRRCGDSRRRRRTSPRDRDQDCADCGSAPDRQPPGQQLRAAWRHRGAS